MLDPRRLEFITRHFRDLQRIRWAPVQLALILALVWHWVPHVSVGLAQSLFGAFLLLTGGFYWWSTKAIRQRYGSVQPPSGEGNRMMKHPVIAVVGMIYVAASMIRPFFKHSDVISNVSMTAIVLIFLLITILDRTNIPRRRIAYGIGLIVLFGGGALILDIGDAAAVISLAGLVWFSLSLYDFVLLRRTFADVRG